MFCRFYQLTCLRAPLAGVEHPQLPVTCVAFGHLELFGGEGHKCRCPFGSCVIGFDERAGWSTELKYYSRMKRCRQRAPHVAHYFCDFNCDFASDCGTFRRQKAPPKWLNSSHLAPRVIIPAPSQPKNVCQLCQTISRVIFNVLHKHANNAWTWSVCQANQVECSSKLTCIDVDPSANNDWILEQLLYIWLTKIDYKNSLTKMGNKHYFPIITF